MRSALYWIDLGANAGVRDTTGALATAARPRGGDWLQAEVDHWKRNGVDRVVSMLTAEEVHELDLVAEPDICMALGVQWRSVPVPDFSVPPDRHAFVDAARSLAADLAGGETIVVHCRMGIGRATMMAAAIIVARGWTVDEALAAITRARGRPVPDTAEQRAWLHGLD